MVLWTAWWEALFFSWLLWKSRCDSRRYMLLKSWVVLEKLTFIAGCYLLDPTHCCLILTAILWARQDYFMLKMMAVRLREVKLLAQDHTASRRQGQDLEKACLTPETELLTAATFSLLSAESRLTCNRTWSGLSHISRALPSLFYQWRICKGPDM